MAKVFLDANRVLDLLERQKGQENGGLAAHILYVSPLSLHVLAYVFKHSCPSEVLKLATEAFALVSLDAEVARRSALGPTADFEDNIQLQSASAAECDYFLTSDRGLLTMGFFGKMRIVTELPA